MSRQRRSGSQTVKEETQTPYLSQAYEHQFPSERQEMSMEEQLTYESLAASRAFYVLIIITTIFFIVTLGTLIALLVNFNNILFYITVSSGMLFALLLLLTVFIIGMKQFEKKKPQYMSPHMMPSSSFF